jgi:hypothetical protein
MKVWCCHVPLPVLAQTFSVPKGGSVICSRKPTANISSHPQSKHLVVMDQGPDDEGLWLLSRPNAPLPPPVDAGDIHESLYPFPDEIIIQDRESATRYARHLLNQGTTERYLVLWVDASVQKFPPVKRKNRLSAAAVAYVDFSSKEWKESVTLKTLRYGTRFAFEAEFVAIKRLFALHAG